MIPKRYLIATLFIAAMLMLMAVVRGPGAVKGGTTVEVPGVAGLESFETLAETRLQDGWSPRFQGTMDPDQPAPWPFCGGFGAPWEPASPYLADQGVSLNGPLGRSEVLLWRGLEWRTYRFDSPIASARLDPRKGSRLLVTLARSRDRFETRLIEIPEGRVLWACESGPWSRFSWDGRAVLLELPFPAYKDALLLSVLTCEGGAQPVSLAPWDEKGMPPPPRGWAVTPEQLGEDVQDWPGHRLLVPWKSGGKLWFPQEDRLWISCRGQWTLWSLERGQWKRLETGDGDLTAHPPLNMGKLTPSNGETTVRTLTALDRVAWQEIPKDTPPWPVADPAWLWWDDAAVTPWDQRWGNASEEPPRERQRKALFNVYRPEWLAASSLRASVQGWLPDGPEVALREGQGVGWVWVGDRILLVRLPESERLRSIRDHLRLR